MRLTAHSNTLRTAAMCSALAAVCALSVAFVGALPVLAMSLIHGGTMAVWLALGSGAIVLGVLATVCCALTISTRERPA